MFLSVVHGPADGPLRLANLPQMQQRFNVAASRARDQMWVVYSLDPRVDLKPGDLRRRLVEHALDPEATSRALENETRRTESPFEREVLQRLIARGYRVRSQWRAGHYRIDLVVEGGGKRLAVECDGDRYHPIEKLPEDMERQAILERLGWRFVRLRGSAFFRDRDATMEKVFERLRELDIPPDGLAEQQPTETAGGNELLEQIKRRAADIRDEWRMRDSTELPADECRDDDVPDGDGAPANCDGSLPLKNALADQGPGPALVVVAEKGVSSGELGSIASTAACSTQCQTVFAEQTSIEIWRMTRGEFHRHKESILPLHEIDRQAINHEFAAAIRKAMSEGKEVAHATLRELGMV